ncbi:hypothetical protein [Paenibacillus taiwanensis]|uniref:hypothetical protein n=1 Tax=Paenibacillus taiwanensis TaxID=401638 RepID=UPI0004076997|nr:hypothetical protein [Paenibacillus taiwanensis]
MVITKKTKVFSLVACSIILLVISYLVIYSNNSGSLSSERIHQLRLNYPAYNNESAMYHVKRPSFQEIAKVSESIISAEVIGELPEYEIDLFGQPNTPEFKINEKMKKNGLPTKRATFVQYEVKVLETLNDEPVNGNIKLVYNKAFKDAEVDLKKGTKIITVIAKGDTVHEGKHFFTKFGTYYIVDNDYVLSAVDDDFSKKMNGKTVTSLLDEIKSMELLSH